MNLLFLLLFRRDLLGGTGRTLDILVLLVPGGLLLI